MKLRVRSATVAIMLAGLAIPSAAAAKFVNWPQYLFSSGHSSRNRAAKTITPKNAHKLFLAWRFSPPTAPSGLPGFYSSPTVVNGVIYIGARNGYFYAIREKTGKVIWKRLIGYVQGKTCGPEGFTSTATVTRDPKTHKRTVYVYGASGFVYAINAASGRNVWRPAKVGVPSPSKNDYYAWGSPLVAHGNIYVGISSQCDNPLVRGGLVSFSASTGKRRGTFWTTPPGTRGASIWSSPAGKGKSLYITTGNGPTGSSGYSIIKLSSTLKKQGSWTVPSVQRVPDSDFGASPTLWSAKLKGRRTGFVGACNKNGVYYALRQSKLSAGPVWLRHVGNPDNVGPGQCDGAAIFDGSRLYVPSNGTKIRGKARGGAVRAVNPATGKYIWQTGLSGPIIGSPGMDGAGVIAAATFQSPTKHNGLFLLNARNGKVLKSFSFLTASTFAQPVFADKYLLVASTAPGLRAYKVP